jgi:1,4-dihydroxy-2-naphthoate octaprenyltransferase
VLYVALVAGAIALALVCAFDRLWSLLALLAAAVAVAPVRRVRSGAVGRDLIAVLGATGKVQLAYGALLTLGLALG